MRRILQLVLVSLLVLPLSGLSAEKGMTVKGVRHFSYAAFTRIVFEVEAAAPYVVTKASDGRSVLLSAYDGPLAIKFSLPVVIRDGMVRGIEAKEDAGRNVLAIGFDAPAGEVKDFVLRGPDRVVLDIMKGAGAPAAVPVDDKPVVVALDAGHGGRDTGIVTAQGQEKTIALEVVQSVKRILQKNPHVKVVLTRDKDSGAGLDERAAAANAAGASIFVTVHTAPGAGTRVYIQDPADDLGAQVSRPAGRDFLGFEAGSEMQERLWGRQQAAHTKESGALGRALARQLSGRDSDEPEQAPLAALKAVDAAAVLVEIGIDQDRRKAVEAIARGIEQHAGQDR